MKTFYTACFFISFFSSLTSYSQSDVLKWSKLSEKEINLTSTPLDSNATAVGCFGSNQYEGRISGAGNDSVHEW